MMLSCRRVPYKVLDAPALQDDFYLNLIDWSASNVLAVGLGSSVYLWSACTSKVTKLHDFGGAGGHDSVTSVAWMGGAQLVVGMNSGGIQVWDTAHSKLVREMEGHTARWVQQWQCSAFCSALFSVLRISRDIYMLGGYLHAGWGRSRGARSPPSWHLAAGTGRFCSKTST
jgi:cell division cycle 20-like protein 1, cofactor of APC complex